MTDVPNLQSAMGQTRVISNDADHHAVRRLTALGEPARLAG